MRIGIPVYSGFDILDVTGPWEMFRWAGFEQELVAQTPGPITCFGGLQVKVDKSFADAKAPYDAIWTPGGDPEALNTLMYGEDRGYLDFLVKQSATAKYVTSVCEGALLLAAAGLLDGYTITTHWAFCPVSAAFRR
jgi:putative intracellular protease/amidase